MPRTGRRRREKGPDPKPARKKPQANREMEMLELVVTEETSRPGIGAHNRIVVTAKRSKLRYQQADCDDTGPVVPACLAAYPFYMVCGDTQFKSSALASRRRWFENRYGRTK